jgi:hypothetical protein
MTMSTEEEVSPSYHPRVVEWDYTSGEDKEVEEGDIEPLVDKVHDANT